MPIIASIIEQHAEEVAFLWHLRDTAVRDPHYDLNDLVKLDNRLEAHIDGLRIAGETGWDICKLTLEQEEPGEVFAASVLALESRIEERIEEVVKVGFLSADNCRGLVSAFGWLTQEQANAFIPGFLTSEDVQSKYLGIAASAIHRINPGSALNEALGHQDQRLKARALRAAGELGRYDLLPLLQQSLQDENGACCFWAFWSAAILGHTSAIGSLSQFCSEESPFRNRAIQLAYRLLDHSEAQFSLTELANQPDGLRHAIIGSGVSGDPVRIPWLIELMSQPEYARVAGEAFSMITGNDIAYEDLEGEWPEGFVAGPNEDPEDDNVEMDEDEDLPWPDPGLIFSWWNNNKGNFRNGTRYLAGQPITEEQCQHVLRQGFQRQRAAAAMELALMNPEEPLFNVCAPGFRQKQSLRL